MNILSNRLLLKPIIPIDNPHRGSGDLLGCWLLMSSQSNKNKAASNANQNRTEPGRRLGKHPMKLITHPIRGNQMEWIAVLDKLNISPVIRHQSLRRIQNRMHSPNHPTQSADNQQSYENVSWHKQPNDPKLSHAACDFRKPKTFSANLKA
jgi:hypothetical protein